jgi:hypothetical protein
VDVFIMTDHANNNVIVFGRDNKEQVGDEINVLMAACA